MPAPGPAANEPPPKARQVAEIAKNILKLSTILIILFFC